MRISTLPTTDRPPAPDAEILCAAAFVSNEQLGRLIEAGAAVREGSVLTLAGGARFALQDGLRILGVEPGKTDPYGLTGRCASLALLLERGFVLTAARIALGKHRYDIELGVILHAVRDADRSLPLQSAAPAATDDAALE